MELPDSRARELEGREAGVPQLTELGKQIELLRIGRRISKQGLARKAGTSRQQLWRVMTGKSELTASLRQRLAEVLEVDPRHLGGQDRLLKAAGIVPITALRPVMPLPVRPRDDVGDGYERGVDLPTYLADVTRMERTLRSLPAGAEGRRLKRDLLNLLEDFAAERGVRLSPDFFALRGRALNGDL